MKVLIEAHHPAHIHFWKYPIRDLQQKGHEVLMIARDRDVMGQLLERCDWVSAQVPKRGTGKNRFPFLEMLARQLTVARAIKQFHPDVVASLMGSYTQTAKILGVRHIIFTDTETQAFNHRIAHPFADEIHTPHCFLKDLGPKQVRYRGFHELMFLHPAYFSPDPSVPQRCDSALRPGNYIIIRMSAWNTFHDRGRHGIGEAIYSFVEQFEKDYEIVLSAEEGKIPPGLERFRRRFHPGDFHHLLAHARFVLTEGASTASEAACLGVPSVFINSVGRLGNYVLLDEEYGLVRAFNDPGKGIPFASNWLESLKDGPGAAFEEHHRDFLKAHQDTCGYVVKVLEG